MFVRIVLAASSLAVPLLAARSSEEVRKYSVTDVGVESAGTATGPAGLSDTGFLAGSQAARGDRLAPVGFRRSPGATSGVGAIVVPDRSTWVGSTAVDVNDSGTFVGSFAEEPGATFLSRGYRWKDGVIEELLTPLGQRAFPTAINDAGWIVGYAGIQPPGTPGAVLWDPELRASFVGDLTRAVDVNSRNQVVGYKNDASGAARAFVWDAGELVPLGSLDPRGLGAVYPKAIDAHGRVVGVSLVRGREHAFVWTKKGGMSELLGARSGQLSLDAAALDINDDGWVVGYAPTAHGRSAVLWGPDGAVNELAGLVPALATPGSGTFRALRINSAGQIAGTLENADGSRTVLLTPLPQCSTSRANGASDARQG